jgi:hypothetical protein
MTESDPKRTCPPEVISHYCWGVRSCSVVAEPRAGRAEASKGEPQQHAVGGDEIKKSQNVYAVLPCWVRADFRTAHIIAALRGDRTWRPTRADEAR